MKELIFFKNSLKNAALTLCLIVSPLLIVALNKLTDNFLRLTDWRSELQTMLSEFLSCGGATPSNTPCNIFLAKAVGKVYQIHDFDAPNQAGGFLRANQIYDYVSLNDNWTSLGTADNQDVLQQAADYSNRGKAVIAVYYKASGGHVALILPGNLMTSSNWGMQVPHCASFELDNPKNSFIDGKLSQAFGGDKKSDVKIFGRNF